MSDAGFGSDRRILNRKYVKDLNSLNSHSLFLYTLRLNSTVGNV